MNVEGAELCGKLNADECALVEALCGGLKQAEIHSALGLTRGLYNCRLKFARLRTDSATNFELVSKYTAWRITQGR